MVVVVSSTFPVLLRADCRDDFGLATGVVSLPLPRGDVRDCRTFCRPLISFSESLLSGEVFARVFLVWRAVEALFSWAESSGLDAGLVVERFMAVLVTGVDDTTGLSLDLSVSLGDAADDFVGVASSSCTCALTDAVDCTGDVVPLASVRLRVVRRVLTDCVSKRPEEVVVVVWDFGAGGAAAAAVMGGVRPGNT